MDPAAPLTEGDRGKGLMDIICLEVAEAFLVGGLWFKPWVSYLASMQARVGEGSVLFTRKLCLE